MRETARSAIPLPVTWRNRQALPGTGAAPAHALSHEWTPRSRAAKVDGNNPSGETIAGRLVSLMSSPLVNYGSGRNEANLAGRRGEIQNGRSAGGAHFDQLGQVHRQRHAQRLRVSADAANRSTGDAPFPEARNRRWPLATLALGAGVDPALLQTRRPIAGSPITATTPASGIATLTQITPENVGKLDEVWRFQTGQNQADQVFADSGERRPLHHHAGQPLGYRRAHGEGTLALPASRNNAFHIGHRGAAVYKDTVYLTTPDCHLIALECERRQGQVGRRDCRFQQRVTGRRTRRWSCGITCWSASPGDFDNLPGQLKSIDADTGKTQWIFYSTPPPAYAEPTSGGATGGQMWTTGTYDPDLNLVYVGTGNPTPVLNGDMRPGDNPWTCSIVALNPDTGKLVWGFQVSPHDTHDWDANEVPVLVDANFNGQPRKMLMQASRNGYFFVLDRTNGKNLLTTPFADGQLGEGNRRRWTSDSGSGQGAVARRRPGRAQRERRYQLPVAELRSEAGLFIVSAQDGYGIYFFKPEHGAYGWAGADYNVAGKAFFGRSITNRKDCLEPSDRRRRRAPPAC